MKTYIRREYLQIYKDYLQVCGADIASSQWMRKYGSVWEQDNDFVAFDMVLSLRSEMSYITDDPMFPIHLGLYMANNLGTLLEYGLKSCHDLNEIAELSTQLHDIRSNVITPTYRLTSEHLEFDIALAIFGTEIRVPLLFSTAALSYGFLCKTFGEVQRDHFALYVQDVEPDWFQSIALLIPFHVQFGSATDCIKIDASLLTLVNPADDPRLKMLLLHALQSLQENRAQPVSEEDYGDKVRSILNQSAPSYPNMNELADTLHVSKRTLARRLRSENTSYQNILNDVRIGESIRCLERGLRVNTIASQLGYESTASFINLFKKRTGKTPTEYRKDITKA